MKKYTYVLTFAGRLISNLGYSLTEVRVETYFDELPIEELIKAQKKAREQIEGRLYKVEAVYLIGKSRFAN